MDRQKFIETGDFDREYSLADLLPFALAQELLGPMIPLASFSIVWPDGRVYCEFSHDGFKPSTAGDASALPGPGKPLPVSSLQAQGGCIALRHELENLGYLVFEANQQIPETTWKALQQFIGHAVSQVMHLMYKNRMTAGLHVQVVEDSYRQLEEKAARLARSEHKYRTLSQNLEAEVVRKTEKIKTAQLMLLQQEKLASIGQLAAGMAHEINNPIGFIISNLNTLEANIRDTVHLLRQYQQLLSLPIDQAEPDPGDDPLHRKLAGLAAESQSLDIDFIAEDMPALIQECLQGAGRIGAIVENLRAFTHPSVETIETVDIHRCLETTLSILSGQIAPGVTIQKDFVVIPKVRCNLRELNQVFFHILRNALQAVEGQGVVTVGTHPDGDQTVRVTIADTGSGIAEADQPHLFEPFFTTRPVGSGTGLGLHLAHNIMKKHGGRIEVESVEGSGTTFTIRIPVAGPRSSNDPTDDQP
jgi:two-component system NtrC family sensor kinase